MTNHKVTVELINYDGINVYEFTPDKVEKKRLVIFQHGFTGDKEDGSWGQCLHYATRGFKVIAFDAYGHGERKTKALQNPDYREEMIYFYEIIEKTALEIKHIYETYYKEEYPRYNIAGESMGGMLCFMVGCICEGLSGICSVVGSPSLVKYGYEDMIDNGCKKEEIEGMLEHLHKYDAFGHIELFKDIKMYFVSGTHDKVVPKVHSEKFIEILKRDYSRTDIINKEVDSGHWIEHKHLISMYDWAKDNLE